MFATADTHHIEPELDYKMCLACTRNEFAIFKVIFSYIFLYFICFTYTIHTGISFLLYITS